MKYIDADKLIAFLEQRKKQLAQWTDKEYANQRIDEIDCILDVDITSLQQEQPEVDLEKEIKDCIKRVHCLAVGKEIATIAHYFYELGLNAKSDAPKIKGWVARNENNSLYLHWEKPHQILSCGIPVAWRGSDVMQPIKRLPDDFMPDLKWEDEPIEVELSIRRV